MDVLSDVLRVVRLTGSIFFTANLNDPWSIDSPPSDTIIRHMPQKAECLTLFHIITEGQCWFTPKNNETFTLSKGSVVIFPHGCAHIMGSDPQLRPVPLLDVLKFEELKGLPKVEYGGTGDKTQFVCGYLMCDQRFNPMLGAIPEVIILRKEYNEETLPFESSGIIPVKQDGWLDSTIQHLVDEVQQGDVGSFTLVTRLTELMYIEVLRRYMKRLPEKSQGWLAALRDQQVGRALRFLHAHPENKWNVEKLAGEVGVSRSAFARRFTDLLGESPMRYLTGWRMQLAKSMLQRPELNLSMIAQKIGYDSDYAFNRAFKRYVGEPPGQWREKVTTRV